MTMRNCSTCVHSPRSHGAGLCAITAEETPVLTELHTTSGDVAGQPDRAAVQRWRQTCGSVLTTSLPCPGWHPGDIAWRCFSCGARRIVPGGESPASPVSGCACIEPAWEVLVVGGSQLYPLQQQWEVVKRMVNIHGGKLRSCGVHPMWIPERAPVQDPQELQDVAELRRALQNKPHEPLTLPRETGDGHQRDLLLRFFAAAEVLIKEGEAFWAMTPLVLQLRDNVQPKMLARTGMPYTPYPEESP